MRRAKIRLGAVCCSIALLLLPGAASASTITPPEVVFLNGHTVSVPVQVICSPPSGFEGAALESGEIAVQVTQGFVTAASMFGLRCDGVPSIVSINFGPELQPHTGLADIRVWWRLSWFGGVTEPGCNDPECIIHVLEGDSMEGTVQIVNIGTQPPNAVPPSTVELR
jgi:hypothetical protein